MTLFLASACDGGSGSGASVARPLPTCDAADAVIQAPGQVASPLQVIIGDYHAGLVFPEPLSTSCDTAFEDQDQCLLELTSDCDVEFDAAVEQPSDGGSGAAAAVVRLVAREIAGIQVYRIETQSECVEIRVTDGESEIDASNGFSFDSGFDVDIELYRTNSTSCEAIVEIESNALTDENTAGVRFLTFSWAS